MKKLRVVVLVSPDRSDIYFANQLIKKLNVVGVFIERQDGSTGILRRMINGIRYLIKPQLIKKRLSGGAKRKYYSEKAKAICLEHFGKEGEELPWEDNCRVVYTEGIRAINEPFYVEEIKQMKPDLIAVCGSSILKRDILNIPPKGVLNLHGGLAQRYRGIWTTLWALYNDEPEYVGATVHYVSEGIDDGNIIYQGRPEISEGDNPETLYVKVVKLGIKMMIKAIDDIQNNSVESYPLKERGKLYLMKMVTPFIIEKAWERAEGGTITSYLKEKASRDDKVLIMMEGKDHRIQ